MADILGMFLGGSNRTFSMTDPTAGVLEVDTLEQETHEWNRDVTESPVENGSPIADHVIQQPLKLTITGFISNAPVTGFLEGAVSLVTDGFSSENRVQAAIDKLYSFYASKELVTIYTRYKLYQNMLITNISIPRRPEDGDAIQFTIDATEVRIVSTATTKLPEGVGAKKTGVDAGKSNATDAATQKRATPERNLGNNTTLNSSKASEQARTILIKTGEGLGQAWDKVKARF